MARVVKVWNRRPGSDSILDCHRRHNFPARRQVDVMQTMRYSPAARVDPLMQVGMR